MNPVKLEPKFVERVWGTTALEPWYPNPDRAIGEVWMTSDDNLTSEGVTLRALMEQQGESLLGTAVKPAFGGRFPILVKFLFTSDKLSVQVHPDDVYAHEHEGSPGKTEMWHVLRAEPGAVIAAGFRNETEPIEVRRALFEGNVEELLQWWPAQPGDTFFIPARTVHAIGGGLVICEIQQNSDITYRFWDYGRPRELHIEKSIAVADLGLYGGPAEPQVYGGSELLATCEYFETEKLVVRELRSCSSDAERFYLIVATRGKGTISGFDNREHAVRAGDCYLVPAQCGEYRLHGSPELEVLRVSVPS